MPDSTFPAVRLRRLRRTETLRRMVRETVLSTDDLIWPLFIVPGNGVEKSIGSMPGVSQMSVDVAVAAAKRAFELGIPAVLLFGIPPEKDAVGSAAYDEHGVVQTAVRALKRELPELVVITDVCLCEYTDHGHCGLLSATGEVMNDPTVEVLVREALSHAEAGADIIAPSDMMDGRVGAIRAALDKAGFDQIPILAYAAKFTSGFYGPFREAAESAPAFGDRRAYQMDPANGREALREVALDAAEGADLLMVKPAGPYLDIIRQVRDRFPHPLVAYQVSGEYSAIKAAGQLGWLDEERVMLESLIAIKRAGADLIITYFAPTVARLLAR